MSTLADDLRHAWRTLCKSPGYSAVAILALALGMGANTTIFSTLEAMVLRPVAFPELDRIVSVSESLPKQGLSGISVAPPNYRDLLVQSTVFERLAAVRGRGRDSNLTGDGAPVRLEGDQVTPSFFPLLALAPLLGRTFNDREAETGVRVVVLSYACWQRQFAGDSKIVGRNILLDGASTQVIGVMPAAFDFPIGTDIWQPLPMTTPEMSVRGDHTLYVLGRLRRGVSKAKALAELRTIGANLERQYPATNEARSFSIVPFKKDLSGATRDFVSVLMWAAIFVLLLACANVANLQLARVVSRQKELAIRTALGASRWRIYRQVLVESVMLSLAGAVVGLFVAVWGIAVTNSAVPPFIVQHIAGVKNIRLDGDVLGFTALVAVLTGIFAGLFPALQSWVNSGLYDALKAGTRSSSAVPLRRRLRSLLVVSEMALALVLLIGAGLMVKGFDHLLKKYPGFEEYGVLSARITLAENRYSDAQLRANFYTQTLDRLSAVPGVESASAVRFVPNGWAWQSGTFTVENAPDRRSELDYAGMQAISANYFSQLRIPLRQGRTFGPRDGPDSQPVVIVSESIARRLWPKGDALGHRMRFGTHDSWHTIVGIVADIEQSTMSDRAWPTAYIPISQSPPMAATFLLRTARDPFSIAADARQAVIPVDPNEALYDIRTLRQLSTDNSSGIAFSAHMMMAFGVIALLLAAAGIYAVMAYTVNQRVHEIGVCMAIGAQPRDVLRMVMGDSLKLAATGLVLGLPLALGLGRVMAGLLVGVVRLDASTFVVFTATLMLVALGAAYVPARRAARVDPMVALNCE